MSLFDFEYTSLNLCVNTKNKNVLAVRKRTAPVPVPVFVIGLAGLKAKPDANHANIHPRVSLLVSALPPALRPATLRRSGFKSDTTRTNLARLNGAGHWSTGPRDWLPSALPTFGLILEGSRAVYPHIRRHGHLLLICAIIIQNFLCHFCLAHLDGKNPQKSYPYF